MLWRWNHFLKNTIGFHANFEFTLEWLKVNIACVLFNCHQQNKIKQLSHRGRICHCLRTCQINRSVLQQALRCFSQVLVLFHLLDNGFHSVDFTGIELFDRLIDLSIRRNNNFYFIAQKYSQLVGYLDFLWVGCGNRQDIVLKLKWHDSVHFGHRLTNDIHKAVGNLFVVKRDKHGIPLLCKGFTELLIGEKTERHAHTTKQFSSAGLLLSEHFFQLLFVNQAKVGQD